MAGLSVVFRTVDEINARFDAIVSAGTRALDSFDRIGAAADSSYDVISEGAAGAADAMERAASATDYWTDKVGSYDREAMQAVYPTEELVGMGYKSAEALEEQQWMLELCGQSADSLNRAMEAATNVQSVLNSTMAQADETMEKLINNESISVESKQELEKASMSAMEAMQALAAAQEEATAAMEAYDSVMASGTNDLNVLEGAAERACHAAEELAEANGRAGDQGFGGKSGMTEKNSRYGTYTAEYCRSTGKPMYSKESYERRKNLYSKTQCQKMNMPIKDGEEPVAFYRVMNGYCGLYERKEA